jgi:hypothetical protein
MSNDIYEEMAIINVKEIKSCRYCNVIIEHILECNQIIAIHHRARCGLECLGGGVSAALRYFHSDKCVLCQLESK